MGGEVVKSMNVGRSLIQKLKAKIQCKEHYQLQSSLEETRLSWYAASVANIKQSEFNAQTVPISIKLCRTHSQEGVHVQDWQQKYHTITDSKNSMQRTLPIAIKPWGNQVFAVTVLKSSFGSRDIKQTNSMHRQYQFQSQSVRPNTRPWLQRIDCIICADKHQIRNALSIAYISYACNQL